MPAAAILGILANVGPVGYGTTFLAVFLGFLLLLPALVIACCCILLAAVFEKRFWRRLSLLSVVVVTVLLTPATFVAAWQLRDPIRFLGWALMHEKGFTTVWSTAENSALLPWDDWGGFGMDNESFLVRSTDPMLLSPASVDEWARRRGMDCPVAEVKPMWWDFYVVITYDCAFAGSSGGM